MKKILFALGLLVLASWTFHELEYGLAKRLKGPIYVTGLTGMRFIPFQEENVTYIEYEYADGDLNHVNETLDSIDIASFQQLSADRNADGTGRVDVEYRDKNYEYLIHYGSDEYVVRQRPNQEE